MNLWILKTLARRIDYVLFECFPLISAAKIIAIVVFRSSCGVVATYLHSSLEGAKRDSMLLPLLLPELNITSAISTTG